MTAVTASCGLPRRAAPVVTATCALVRDEARIVHATCMLPRQDTLPVAATCLLPRTSRDPVTAVCMLPRRQGNPATIRQQCLLVREQVDDPPTPPAPPAPASPEDDIRVTIGGGVQVDPIRIGLRWSREQVAIEAELEFGDDGVYDLARRHRRAQLEIWGYTFALVVDGRSRSERFGQWTCTIRLASPAVMLETPWAEPVEGELAGQARDLARQLAGTQALDWRLLDWRIGPGRWIASGQAPADLLRQLVAAVGGGLSSRPDGALVAAPIYSVSPQDWSSATPAARLTATDEIVGLDTGAQAALGINAITVSDGAMTTSTLRVEEDEERRRGSTSEVLVYQTPWRDDFSLTHRGNPAFAGVEPIGLEERAIEDEEIVITDGRGQTQYPVYAILGARYNWRNLGTPTYSEDGELTTAVQDESILLLSYRTRCRRYRVRETNLTDLLVVAEDEA